MGGFVRFAASTAGSQRAMKESASSHRRGWASYGLLIWLLATSARVIRAQSAPDSSRGASYHLSVSVDEVSLIFHATDAHGLPVNNLEPGEVDVFDNEQGPGRVIALQQLENLSIHAGFVVDTSGSVAGHLAHSRAIAVEAAQQLLGQQADSGFAVGFGSWRQVVQPWINSKEALVRAISRIGPSAPSVFGGTSLFDTLFSTCAYEFGKSRQETGRNLILLFSDGEDTASHTTLQEAVSMCQHAHTAIYAFGPKLNPGASSSGPSTLAELTGQTGGRVFHDDAPEAEIRTDIKTIESDLRDEYRLIYRPKQLKHDGSFHKIVLVGPRRVVSIAAQTGYYAPSH